MEHSGVRAGHRPERRSFEHEIGSGWSRCASLGDRACAPAPRFGAAGASPRQQQQRIHAVAQHRHKRKANVRRPMPATLVAAPIAVVATLTAVTMGVLSATPPTTEDLLASRADADVPAAASRHTALTNRRDVVSRSQVRSTAPSVAPARRQKVKASALEKADRLETQATLRAVRSADSKLWTTDDLNLWDAPGPDATQVGLLRARRQVLVTGRRQADRAEVVLAGTARWVTAAYLSESASPRSQNRLTPVPPWGASVPTERRSTQAASRSTTSTTRCARTGRR